MKGDPLAGVSSSKVRLAGWARQGRQARRRPRRQRRPQAGRQASNGRRPCGQARARAACG